MPPSVIDASGACNTFREVPWLSEEEIATLERWQADGAPEGARTIAAPSAPELPKLTGDVETIRTPSYVPSKKELDDYHCFVIDSPFAEKTFITGFDTHPGDLKTAHHMVVFYPMDDGAALLANLADQLEDGPGYTCFGSAGIPATVIAAWAPGAGATKFPDNLGLEVAAGRPLIVQMHYNTSSTEKPGADSTEIAFEHRSTGVSPAAFANMLDIGFSAPPGQAEAEVVIADSIGASSSIKKGPVKVYGMFPHMHELGRTIRVSFGDDDRCLIDAPRYEFAWQRMYFLDKPIEVDAEAKIKLRCVFDTSGRTEPIKWGEGTQDEMCVTGLIVKL
jgi:Copper type II ascorbate-dependent monooxygenase, C-terminal domain/Copper type II ascorbate-dependent monooxygenase, N-terminal domain